MITYIVVDTSYLVELFEVPGHFKESFAKEIKTTYIQLISAIANKRKKEGQLI
jgi:hypothetical protein